MQQSAGAVQFEAVIVPHRSLSRRGLRILVAVLCVTGCLMAIAFWLLGAWPIIGFTGAELGLAAFLLHLNARGARASEMLLLGDDAMRIIRTDAAGRRDERVLPTAWLQVLLQDRPGRTPGLFLVQRDLQEEIGSVLGEAEKRDLAEALSGALTRLRRPVFDNPQLRD